MNFLILTQYLGRRTNEVVICYIPQGALLAVLIFWPCSLSFLKLEVSLFVGLPSP